VIYTATGRVRTWTWRQPRPQSVAWAGDHAIDFATAVPNSHDTARTSTLRRLSTTAPGTSLARAATLVSRFVDFGSLTAHSPWWVSDLQTTANGRTAFAALTSGSGSNTRQVVLRLSARTGTPQKVIGIPSKGVELLDGIYCDVVWTDGSGQHLLVSCAAHSGRVDDGRYTPHRVQPATYVPFPGSIFAWSG
jgi:hypothetical protein